MLELKRHYVFIKVTLVAIAILIVSFFILQQYKDEIKDKIYADNIKNLMTFASGRIQNRFDLGTTHALAVSNDARIKEALKTNNRELAIQSLRELLSDFKRANFFEGLQIHIQTKDNIAFVRSWKEDMYGDNLVSFRKDIVKVNQDKSVVNTFIVGKFGLLLKSIVPIFDNGTHIGSLENSQTFDVIAKLFDKQNSAILLLMDKSYTNIATDADLSKSVSSYVVSQKFINEQFLQDAKGINIETLRKEKATISDKYFYTYIDIKDFDGNILGIALIGKPLDEINQAISKAQHIVVVSMVILFFALLLLYVFTRLIIDIDINKPIKDIISTLKDSNYQITATSTQLSSASINLSDIAQQQANIIAVMNNTLQNTSNIVVSSNSNTQQTKVISKETYEYAQGGYVNVQNLINSMLEINTLSNKIGNIVNTIDEIAFQTNLLALNAAVEAARAGEHGLGFAVVAEEVRNLAGKSANEAKEISKIVEISINQIQQATTYANDTNKTFKDIVTKINQTNELIETIAESSMEQSYALKELNVTMDEVDTVTNLMASNAEETSASAEELSSQASVTNDIVKNLAMKDKLSYKYCSVGITIVCYMKIQ